MAISTQGTGYGIFQSMTVENPDTVFWLVMAILAMILVQSIAFAIAVFYFNKGLGNLQLQTRRLVHQLTQLMSTLQFWLEKTRPLRERIPGWQEELSRAFKALNRSFKELDEHSVRGMGVARTRLKEGRDRSDEILARLAQTTFRVHRAVLDPAHHFSAWVAGVRAGFAEFFAKREKETVKPSPPGPQSFI